MVYTPQNTYYQSCERTDCENEIVAIVKDDPLNGTRLCPECLHQEGIRRGWWSDERY